jgi:peroxiredoxin
MALQTRLDAFKADFESGGPPYNAPSEVIATMHRATAELIASGQAARAKHAGDRFPDFVLDDPDGHPVQSGDLLARGSLVLSFYRGVWCPYCNLELQALQEALPAIEALGVQLVAISPQNPANSRKSVRQNNLAFPILSDARGELAEALGIRFALPDYLIALYKGFKNDLPAFNNDPSWTLPMPARYVVAKDGIIAYAEVNPDYTKRPDPSELLPVLERLRVSAAA